MAFAKLNYNRIHREMAKINLRPADLGSKLGVSRQLAHYIIHRGGWRYAFRLAQIFKCRVEDLIITTLRLPKGTRLTINKIIRKRGQ